LSPEALVAAARALRPVLREHQAETEAANRILPDVHDACFDAGFYRVLQPRRFGGYEYGLATFARVMIELAAGCPSTGWVVAFTAGHIHVLGKYSEHVQAAAYGPEGDVRAPLVEGQINATARPVEGGYRVTGTFDNSSGVDVSTHFMGFCRVIDGETETGLILAMFDREQYTIERNWTMLGMMGTGSHRTVVVDQYVPTDCAPYAMDVMGSTTPPAERFLDNPFYLGPSFNVLMTEIASVAIGIATGVLEEFDAIMRKSKVPRTNTLRVNDREYHLYYGEAFAMIETAKAALLSAADQYEASCLRELTEPGSFNAEESWRIGVVTQQCIRMVADATTILFRSAGSTPYVPGARMNRLFRDMSTVLSHVTLSYDRWAERAARLHFGFE
jgi:3-hydroxy-9,10-secoandrosta-1,3,5(10)-triene-9,17-dione monooxygenase